MELDLQTRQAQTLSSQMIQSVKMLQMTAQELNQYINELALENPVIDVAEPESAEENHYLYHRQTSDEDFLKDRWNYSADEGETLQNYLWSQLVMEDFSSLEKKIITFMLESLDERLFAGGVDLHAADAIGLEFGVQLLCDALGPIAGAASKDDPDLGLSEQQAGDGQSSIAVAAENENRVIFHGEIPFLIGSLQ